MDVIKQFSRRKPIDIIAISDVVTKFSVSEPLPISPYHEAIIQGLQPEEVLPDAPNRKGVAYNIESIRNQLENIFENSVGCQLFLKRRVTTPIDLLEKIMGHYYKPDHIYTNNCEFITVIKINENQVEALLHKSFYNLSHPHWIDPPECFSYYCNQKEAESYSVNKLTKIYRPPIDPFESAKAAEKYKPMPEENIVLKYGRSFTKDEYELLKVPIIPNEMEDKWFIYMESRCLKFFRSWTGHCIFQVQLEEKNANEKYVAKLATVNRNPSQFKSSDDTYDLRLLNFLIDALLLKDRKSVFPLPKKLNRTTPKGLYQHAIAGTAYQEDENT